MGCGFSNKKSFDSDEPSSLSETTSNKDWTNKLRKEYNFKAQGKMYTVIVSHSIISPGTKSQSSKEKS